MILINVRPSHLLQIQTECLCKTCPTPCPHFQTLWHLKGHLVDLRHADKLPFDIFYESAIVRVDYSKIFRHILKESLKDADWKESDHTDLLLHLRTCTAQFQVAQLANFTPGLIACAKKSHKPVTLTSYSYLF